MCWRIPELCARGGLSMRGKVWTRVCEEALPLKSERPLGNPARVSSFGFMYLYQVRRRAEWAM